MMQTSWIFKNLVYFQTVFKYILTANENGDKPESLEVFFGKIDDVGPAVLSASVPNIVNTNPSFKLLNFLKTFFLIGVD